MASADHKKPNPPNTRLQEGEYEVTVPSVGDRVAQTVAALALEPRTEAIFHEDSYGYRPRKGALDAVAVCRQRCWARSWVIDLDIRKFFDSVSWDLVVKAVEVNVTHEQRWITLYVRRWLAAPIVLPDSRTEARDKGTPQGSLCSAEHKEPYEQCRVMRSADPPGLVGAGWASEHCA